MAARDHVDEIVELWKEREPDVDATSLHVVGRLLRAAAEINRVREDALRQFGLTVGDFDVLATLRRVSGPAGLNAKHLSRSALITSGAMTTRLDRLERAGLVERRPDPDDRRGVLVRLTSRGQQSAGDAVRAVLSAHDDYLRGLPDRDRDKLVAALRKLLAGPG
jgi:DNA-binding MarR family transcriptional regulator